MTVKRAIPYLFFDGTADEALKLYERALGARVENLMRYEEMPADAGTCPPEDARRVMHAMVRVGEVPLMVSDVPKAQPGPAGGNVHVNLDFDDAGEMTRAFQALAASGEIMMDLHDAFWGAKFGALTDAYGIRWMFTCAHQGR